MNTYLGRVADRRGITELLYEHDWNGDEGRCECGWTHPGVVRDPIEFDHAYHVAGVLKDAYEIAAREFAD